MTFKTNKSKIIVFGCGSQAKYVIDNLSTNKSISINDFIIVDLEINKKSNKYQTRIDKFFNLDDALDLAKDNRNSSIIAHGNNNLKEEIAKKLNGVNFVNAFHPNVSMSSSVSINSGNIINSGAIILPNAKIGSHCIIHSGCVIEHDCIIRDFSNIAPGVVMAGGVEVGEKTYLYTGVKVGPGVKIGNNCVIGAGSVVLKNLPSGVRAYGVPAKVIEN